MQQEFLRYREADTLRRVCGEEEKACLLSTRAEASASEDTKRILRTAHSSSTAGERSAHCFDIQKCGGLVQILWMVVQVFHEHP